MRRALLLIVLGLLGACGDKARIEAVLALTGDPVAGENIYVNICAECHGEDLRGTVDGPNLLQLVPRNPDNEIVGTILEGPDEMPSFRDDFVDQQIADTLAFLRQAAP